MTYMDSIFLNHLVCLCYDKKQYFAYIITSIPAYYGYYVKGGAIAVGSASTKGVVSSSIVILIVNYVITQLLLI